MVTHYTFLMLYRVEFIALYAATLHLTTSHFIISSRVTLYCIYFSFILLFFLLKLMCLITIINYLGIELRLNESTYIVEERERCLEKKVRIRYYLSHHVHYNTADMKYM